MPDALKRIILTVLSAAALIAGSCSGAGEDETAAMPHPSKIEPIKYIYVVPSSHLDIGFTDTPSNVAARRAENLSDVLTYCADHPDFRWSEEQGWGVHQWLKMNEGNAKELGRLRAALKSGQVSIGATYVTAHAKLMGGAVGLLACLNPLLKRELGYSPKVAIQNDVPDVPPALVDALFERGVKYLLLGPNNSFTTPLATPPANTPIYLRGMKHRLLAFIDNDGYTAAYTVWGIDPSAARIFAAKKFGQYKDDLELMKAGINEQVGKLVARGYPYDAVIVQHSFDNWTPDAAENLPKFAKLWNESVGSPKIIIARPEEFFDHISRAYRTQIPTYGGEWGGSWDAVRSATPETTHRLMAAAKALERTTDLAKASAVSAAFDHNVGLGPTWPGYFDQGGFEAHDREIAEIISQAVAAGGEASGRGTADEEPAVVINSPVALTREEWDTELDPPLGIIIGHAPGKPATIGDLLRACELRAAPRGLGSALAPQARTLDVIQQNQWLKDAVLPMSLVADMPGGKYQVLMKQDDRNITVWATVERSALAENDTAPGGMAYGWVIKLAVPPSDITVGLGDSPGPTKWLIGKLPPLITAPEGLTLWSSTFKLRITSPRLFVYSVIPDQSDPQGTLLIIQDFIQSLTVTLKGGEKKTFPFETVYPGEPSSFVGSFEMDYSKIETKRPSG